MRLHRQGDAVGADAGHVCRIDDLRALDAPAPVARVGSLELLDGVEHRCDGAVARGAYGDLEVVDRAAAHQVLELGLGQAGAPGARRIVGIGRLQRGGAVRERTVEREEQAVQPQPVPVEPWRGAGAADQRHGFRSRRVGDDPQVEPAQVAGAAIGLPILDRRAHVGNGGDALGQQQLLGLGERRIAVFGARRRQGAAILRGRRGLLPRQQREPQLHHLHM